MSIEPRHNGLIEKLNFQAYWRVSSALTAMERRPGFSDANIEHHICALLHTNAPYMSIQPSMPGLPQTEG